MNFAENVLLAGSPFGIEMHNLYNVTRVPTAAACPTELQYGTAGLDLYASASGLAIPFSIWEDRIDITLFYAGSVTGSIVQFPSEKFLESRYYTSNFYALSGVAMTYAAPFAPLLSRDDGLQVMIGDFVAGAEVGLPNHPEVATLRLGYVYSRGLYSNLTSKRLRLFATALLTNEFALLALAKGGLSKVDLPWEKAGQTSLFGRNQVLKGPSDAERARRDDPAGGDGATQESFARINLTTIHFQQQNIGKYVSVSAALAVLPKPFLHEGSITISVPVKDQPFVSGTIGVTEMPALPWYATEGGRKLYFDLEVGNFLHLRRNDPDTLVIFPYAEDATEFSIVIEFSGLMAERAAAEEATP